MLATDPIKRKRRPNRRYENLTDSSSSEELDLVFLVRFTNGTHSLVDADHLKYDGMGNKGEKAVVRHRGIDFTVIIECRGEKLFSIVLF